MKLDKIKFAKLVGFCAANGMTVGDWELNQIDELCDVGVLEQEVQTVYPMNDAINDLMRLMVAGTQKIEAIKVHRAITGFGLKESKDAVEKYWPRATVKETLNDMLDIVDKTMTGQTTMLSGFESSELSMIKNFINTYVVK